MSDNDGMIDPNNPDFEKPPERFLPHQGRKVFAITSIHRDVAPFGPTIEVGLVVLKDLEPGVPGDNPETDEGLCSTTKLTNNDRGKKWIGLFAKALKFNQPFNPSKDEGHFDLVIKSNRGILIGTVTHREYVKGGVVQTTRDGKIKMLSEVQRYEPADLEALGLLQDGALTQDVLDLIQKGENEFDEMLTKRSARSSGATRGGGGGGSPRAAAPSRAAPASSTPATDDDIPF